MSTHQDLAISVEQSTTSAKASPSRLLRDDHTSAHIPAIRADVKEAIELTCSDIAVR